LPFFLVNCLFNVMWMFHTAQYVLWLAL
jgi:hypothetical protein